MPGWLEGEEAMKGPVEVVSVAAEGVPIREGEEAVGMKTLRDDRNR